MKTELERSSTDASAAGIGHEMSSSLGYQMNNVSSGYLEFSFGPFRLIPEQQLLVEDGKPVNVGARGLELLRALVENSGKVLSKDELISRIWPDTCVSESNLKVQVAALRRALGEGRRGERYVATVSGRGYRFVAPVKRQDACDWQGKTLVATEHNLAPERIRLLGGDQIIEALIRQLPARRCNTIPGSGGVGNTTVAVALVNVLAESYRDGMWLVADALPSMLGHKTLLIVLE
jgi:DNA-binding winged helix-turn-helix (wHTH) protein